MILQLRTKKKISDPKMMTVLRERIFSINNFNFLMKFW